MKQSKIKTDFVPPYSYRVYGAETVVYDRKGKRVVACPTEKEAQEYIKELEIKKTNKK